MRAARLLSTVNERSTTDEGSVRERFQIAQAEWRKLFTQETLRSHRSPVNREVFLTQANQRSNIAWGDELQEKADDTFRVYGVNVNGFQID